MKEEIRVIFGGDFCPLNAIQSNILRGGSREVFGDSLAVLHDKDLSLVNLEAPLTTADSPITKSGPNLKVHPDCVKALKIAGVDVAILANNHIGDHGPGPVVKTFDVLRKNGIHYVGAGVDIEDARKPLFLTRKGRRIAILAFAENEFGIARRKFPGANPLRPAENIGQIRAAAKKADITLVVIHGGNEYNPVPSPRMRETYRAFAEAGASAVIGGHTHCPQGMENWAGSPVVYSMGNLLFDLEGMRNNVLWWKGYMAGITFGRSRSPAVEVFPYRFDSGQIRMLRGMERDLFIHYIKCLSRLAADDDESVHYWEAWCAYMAPSFMRCFNNLKWPPKNTKKSRQPFVALRNLFACEAHQELVESILELWRFGRLEKADAYIPRIKILQKGLPLNYRR